MRTHATKTGLRPLVMVAAATLAVGLALPRTAHAQSCTTLGTQACCPTFGDAGSFVFGLTFAKNDVKAGIMTFCGGDMFCPQALVTRADMAVFLENAMQPAGTAFLPATGTFADVPVSFPLACWIEQFYRDGVTAGCGLNPPVYCPDSPVTRAQMAVFILKAKNYPNSYYPPQCTGIFTDVSCSPTKAFAVDWIEELYHEGITAGCSTSPMMYCPDRSVTREQMAVFLFQAFGVPSSCP